MKKRHHFHVRTEGTINSFHVSRRHCGEKKAEGNRTQEVQETEEATSFEEENGKYLWRMK